MPGAPTPSNVLSQRFRVGERIASGGMASVYAGEVLTDEDPLAGKPLAIKILHDHLTEDAAFVRMFRDEGRIAARFDHAHIVRVFAVGEDAGRHYIVMERVFGHNLAELLQAYRKRRRVVPKAAAFEILRQLLGALTYVHGFKGKGGRRLGIVHRDISPHNVLIDVQERVRLTDFGIARGQHRTDLTRTGTVKGKLHYMSPEQARGKRVDARADLYAVGAVAWELFTERPLLQADRTEALQARVMSGAIDLSSKKFEALHPDLQSWIRKALAIDKTERFQSAEAMLAALGNVKGAGASRLKPGTLTRMLEILEVAAPSDAQQPLLHPSEGRSTGGSSDAAPPSVVLRTPQRPISGVFVGPQAVSRNSSTPSQRLRMVTDADLERSRKRRRKARRRAPVSQGAADAAVRMSEVIALQAAGVDAEVPAVEPEVVERSRAAKPEPQEQGAEVRVSRVLVQRQRGVAFAGMVAWSCLALLLFGTLLEVWNARVTLPRVDEQTFEGSLEALIGGGVAAVASPEAPEASEPVVVDAARPIERAAVRPAIRNDRFLPRGAALPGKERARKPAAKPTAKPAAKRAAKAPSKGAAKRAAKGPSRRVGKRAAKGPSKRVGKAAAKRSGKPKRSAKAGEPTR